MIRRQMRAPALCFPDWRTTTPVDWSQICPTEIVGQECLSGVIFCTLARNQHRRLRLIRYQSACLQTYLAAMPRVLARLGSVEPSKFGITYATVNRGARILFVPHSSSR